MKFFDLELGGLGSLVVQHTILGPATECNFLAFGGGTTIEQCQASSAKPLANSSIYEKQKDGSITKTDFQVGDWRRDMGCWRH